MLGVLRNESMQRFVEAMEDIEGGDAVGVSQLKFGHRIELQGFISFD